MARISVDVQDTSFEPLSEGPYRAVVRKLSPQPVKPGKEFPTMRIDMSVTVPPDQINKVGPDGKVPITTFISLAPQAGWKLEEFLNGCRLQPGIDFEVTDLGEKRKKIAFDTERVEGREVGLVLRVEPDKDANGNPKVGGRLRNTVESFYAV